MNINRKNITYIINAFELSSKRKISRFLGGSSHQRKTYLVLLFTFNICNPPKNYGVRNLSKCNRQKISTKCNFTKGWPKKCNDLYVNLVYPWISKAKGMKLFTEFCFRNWRLFKQTILHFPIIRSTQLINPLPSALYIPLRSPAYFQDSQFSLFECLPFGAHFFCQSMQSILR